MFWPETFGFYCQKFSNENGDRYGAFTILNYSHVATSSNDVISLH
jgi:hypothetical protein